MRPTNLRCLNKMVGGVGMGKIFIAYPYALLGLRAIGARLMRRPAPCGIRRVSDVETSAVEIRRRLSFLDDFKPEGEAYEIHILVPRRKDLRHMKGIKTHLCSRELPAESFWDLGDDIYLVTPERCFLEAAMRGVDQERLMAFGMELCGTYSLAYGNEDGFANGTQLTYASRLVAYLRRYRHVRGIAKARRAMACVVDGADSPRETATCLALTMSTFQGGYGIARPFMGEPIVPKDSQRELCSQSHYLADMLWKKPKLIVEYDGGHHDEPARAAKDKRRRSELAALGYTVIVVNNDDVESHSRFDQKAAQVSRCLRRRRRKPTPGHAIGRKMFQRSIFSTEVGPDDPLATVLPLLPAGYRTYRERIDGRWDVLSV